jgi:hypothetical protein
MDPHRWMWMAAAYTVITVGYALKTWDRTFRLCLIVVVLAAVGVTVWFVINGRR